MSGSSISTVGITLVTSVGSGLGDGTPLYGIATVNPVVTSLAPSSLAIFSTALSNPLLFDMSNLTPFSNFIAFIIALSSVDRLVIL
jgi:hypothetical protein